jgi:hypothetical protein
MHRHVPEICPDLLFTQVSPVPANPAHSDVRGQIPSPRRRRNPRRPRPRRAGKRRGGNGGGAETLGGGTAEGGNGRGRKRPGGGNGGGWLGGNGQGDRNARGTETLGVGNGRGWGKAYPRVVEERDWNCSWLSFPAGHHGICAGDADGALGIRGLRCRRTSPTAAVQESVGRQYLRPAYRDCRW